jgi:DNA replication and repair protein RecF
LLQRIVCHRFRNLEPLDWTVDPGRQLLLGANGAGKTSLIEAIYVLATTRSFRASRMEECVREGEASFAVEGRIGGSSRIDLSLTWTSGEGIERRVNGKRSELTRHLGALPLVAWSAVDHEVFAGAPEARRRFLDQGIVGILPAAVEDLSRYRQALRQKRELLLRGGRGLAAWNVVLAGAAARLASRRAEYCRKIAAAFLEELRKTGVGIADVSLAYRPSPPEALEGEEAILESIRRVSSSERERRSVLVGPHRDELEISMGRRPLRRTASSGERKVLGLVLLAARASVMEGAGRRPLVLVDDADAELDRGRLQAVWTVLSQGRQVIATSSRPEVWRDLPEVVRWQVREGAVSRADGKI